MTNLITILSLTLATNWTGILVGTNEMGYVSTNHSLTVHYDGTEHTFTLKSVPSNVAVWRPTQRWGEPIYLTNFPNIWTNRSPWAIPAPTNIWQDEPNE